MSLAPAGYSDCSRTTMWGNTRKPDVGSKKIQRDMGRRNPDFSFKLADTNPAAVLLTMCSCRFKLSQHLVLDRATDIFLCISL